MRFLHRKAARKSQRPSPAQLYHRPRLECLEDRTSPAVLSVNPASPTAYHTIQSAVNAAHPGDTIQVAQAVYTENVVISKSLSLIGLPNGKTLPQIVGTGSNVGTESVVQVAANTNNVLIQGFGISSPHGLNPTEIGILIGTGATNITVNGGIIRHLRDSTHPINGASQTTAVVVSPKAHNVLLTHLTVYNVVYDTTNVNISQQYAYGFVLASNTATDGPSSVLIQHNYISKVGDIGIDITNGAHDVTANYNTVDQIYGLHVSYGILVSGITGTPTNILLFNNQVDLLSGKQPVGIAVLGTASAVQLVDNTVSGLTAGIGLQIGGHASVSGNQNNFAGNATGVLVQKGFSGSLVLHYNNIDGNTHAGIENDSTQSVDAEANWWGAATGPTSTGNPGGTGDKIIGPVDFSSWLTFAIVT
jgi:hypothetical protein